MGISLSRDPSVSGEADDGQRKVSQSFDDAQDG
jgi:hypothetical protein